MVLTNSCHYVGHSFNFSITMCFSGTLFSHAFCVFFFFYIDLVVILFLLLFFFFHVKSSSRTSQGCGWIPDQQEFSSEYKAVCPNVFSLYFSVTNRHQPCRLLEKQRLIYPPCLTNKVPSTNMDHLCNFSFSPAFPTSQDCVPNLVHGSSNLQL